MMGKANFPKNQSKLHDPMYAKPKTPTERFLNKLHNYRKMMDNRIKKRRAKKTQISLEFRNFIRFSAFILSPIISFWVRFFFVSA